MSSEIVFGLSAVSLFKYILMLTTANFQDKGQNRALDPHQWLFHLLLSYFTQGRGYCVLEFENL